MTVKHLRTVYKHKLACKEKWICSLISFDVNEFLFLAAAAVDPTIASKYRAGYGECANEIIRFLTTTPNADLELKTKLISHLSTRIQNLSSLSILPPIQPTFSTIHPNNGLLTKTDRYSVNSSTNNQYIFILPQQEQQQQQQMQDTLKIHHRNNDDADCSSTSSNNSSDCESMRSPASTTTESQSKVWRPWWPIKHLIHAVFFPFLICYFVYIFFKERKAKQNEWNVFVCIVNPYLYLRQFISKARRWDAKVNLKKIITTTLFTPIRISLAPDLLRYLIPMYT